MGVKSKFQNEAHLSPTRDRIRNVAEELYVLRGHAGFSFGDVAASVGTTRANIHHHFGSKSQLMAELIEGFAADAQKRIRSIWVEGPRNFSGRLLLQVQDLRRFYDRFNPNPGDRNVWSPLSRLRLDLPLLGDIALRGLQRVDAAYDSCLTRAVSDAIANATLRADTPIDDVSRLLRVTLMSCGPITQDSGDFAEVERLFAALGRTLEAAWGVKGVA
jgi:AcrR family transcriptional regulator